MAEPRDPNAMDQQSAGDWATAGRETDAALDGRLRALATVNEYPPTPDLAAAVGARLRAAARPDVQPASPDPGERPATADRGEPRAAADIGARRAQAPVDLGERRARRLRLRRSTLLALAAVLILAGVAVALAFTIGSLRITFVPSVPTARPTPVATPSAAPTSPPARGSVGGSVAPGTTPSPTASPGATPKPAAPGATLGLGRQVAFADAAGAVGFRPLAPPAIPVLGTPDAVYVDSLPTNGMLSYVYLPRPGFPETTPGSGVGLLVTQFDATIQDALFEKQAGPGTTVTRTMVNGEPGFYLSGQLHAFLYRRPGVVDQYDDEPFRLVGTALVWQHGSVVVRIEGDLTLDRALEVARSIQ